MDWRRASGYALEATYVIILNEFSDLYIENNGGHVGELYVSGSEIQNDVMGFILATTAMLELERSVPLDLHLKRKQIL